MYAEAEESEDQISEILVFLMENGLVHHILIQAMKEDFVQILQLQHHLIDLVVNSDLHHILEVLQLILLHFNVLAMVKHELNLLIYV